MKSPTGIAVLVTVIIIIFFTTPLSITSIVLSQKETTCDITDLMGLNVADYLLGLGISGLTTSFLILVTYIGAYKFAENNSSCGGCMVLSSALFIYLQVLFSFCWFIVGAIILFRSNIACINEGGVVIIYALVMWCLATFSIIKDCCSGKKKNDNEK